MHSLNSAAMCIFVMNLVLDKILNQKTLTKHQQKLHSLTVIRTLSELRCWHKSKEKTSKGNLTLATLRIHH